MSEKHLSASAWKDFCKKHDLEDKELADALARFGRLPEADFDARQDGLKEVEKAVAKLAKDDQFKKDKEASKYLDEVEAECGKKRKELEKAEEEAAEEEGEDDEESAELRKDLKKQMVTVLGRVRSMAPAPELSGTREALVGQHKFMAYVAGSTTSVVIAKKTASSLKGFLRELAGGATGGTFVKGTCLWEEGTTTFALETVPGGLAGKLSRALLREVDKKIKVRVRTSDGTEVSDSDAEEEENETQTAGDASGKAPTEAEFKSRLATVVGKIKEGMAAKHPGVDQARQLASESGELAKKGNLADAMARLDAVERALSSSGAPPSLTPEPPVTPGGGDKLSVWTNARASAVADLKKVASWVAASQDPEAREAIVQLQSVIKQLTEKPTSKKQVQELRRYLQTDEVIDEVQQAPAQTGLTVKVRDPLLAALTELEPSLAD